jgi:hypothetical protein
MAMQRDLRSGDARFAAAIFYFCIAKAKLAAHAIF